MSHDRDGKEFQVPYGTNQVGHSGPNTRTPRFSEASNFTAFQIASGELPQNITSDRFPVMYEAEPLLLQATYMAGHGFRTHVISGFIPLMKSAGPSTASA